jgi:DNA mismatch repair protein MLH1
LLLDKREMLDEYFSLKLSEEGQIETLPMLLKGYTPNLDRLPHFLLCLGTQVSSPHHITYCGLIETGRLG